MIKKHKVLDQLLLEELCGTDFMYTDTSTKERFVKLNEDFEAPC